MDTDLSEEGWDSMLNLQLPGRNDDWDEVDVERQKVPRRIRYPRRVVYRNSQTRRKLCC